MVPFTTTAVLERLLEAHGEVCTFIVNESIKHTAVERAMITARIDVGANPFHKTTESLLNGPSSNEKTD